MDIEVRCKHSTPKKENKISKAEDFFGLRNTHAGSFHISESIPLKKNSSAR